MDRKFISLKESIELFTDPINRDPTRTRNWVPLDIKEVCPASKVCKKIKKPICEKLPSSKLRSNSKLKKCKRREPPEEIPPERYECTVDAERPKPEYLNYMKMLKTQEELRENRHAREDVIKLKQRIGTCRNQMPDAKESLLFRRELLKVNSPTAIGQIKPEPASRSPSQQLTFIPTEKLLELKHPRSGVFVNETKIDENTCVPYDTYNPRVLQAQLNDFQQHYVITDRNGKLVAQTEQANRIQQLTGRFCKNKICQHPCMQSRAYSSNGNRSCGAEYQSDRMCTKTLQKSQNNCKTPNSGYTLNQSGRYGLNKNAESNPCGKSEDVTKREKDNLANICQKFCRDDTHLSNDKQPNIPNELLESYSLTNLHIPEKLTLGMPVGILLGSYNINDLTFSPKSRSRQGLACIFIAFGYSYIVPERQWNVQIIDDILSLGNKLYLESVKMAQEQPVRPENMLPKFSIHGNHVELQISKAIIVGNITTDNPRIANIYKGLCIYFRSRKVGVIIVNEFYLLIWRKCGSYYVFDPSGRTCECKQDKVKGSAALITLRSLDNVTHLIINLCQMDIELNSLYMICELKIIKLLPNQRGDVIVRENNKENFFTLINDHRAILRGTFHIGDACYTEARNKQSLAISCIAILYAKINHPASWTSDTIDKIMSLGTKFFEDCVKYDMSIEFTINNLPSIVNIGPYRVEIIIMPLRCCGTIDKVDDYKCAEITRALIEFFKTMKACIVQVDEMYFSMWEKNCLYYCFDPYNRDSKGEVPEKTKGTACLQMHDSVESMCEVFYNNMIQVAKDCSFFLHCIKVMRVDKIDPNVYRTESERFQVLKEIKLPSCSQEQILLHKKDVASVDGTVDDELVPQECIEMRRLFISPDAHDLNSPSVSVTQYMPMWKAIQEKKYHSDESSECPSEIEAPSPVPSYIPLCNLSKLSVFEPRRPVEAPPPPLPPKPPIPQICETDSESEEEAADPETEQIVCLLIEEIINGIFDVCWKRCVNAGECTDEEFKLIADDILLQSDLGYLKLLEQKVKQGLDFDNIYEEFKVKPDEINEMITLSRELLIDSNFDPLPDGSSIISGTINLIQLGDFAEALGVLVGVTAVLLSHKYCIATWDSNVIDTAILLAASIQKKLPIKRNTLFSSPRVYFPRVRIGSLVYTLSMCPMARGIISNLYNMIEKCLERIDRLVVISLTYSFAVFKRKNFYYLFEGYPCDFIGFVTTNADLGKSCLIRFTTLNSLIRRVICNRNDLNMNQTILISHVNTIDVTREGLSKFVNRSQSEEETAYTIEQLKKDAKDRRISEKLAFLTQEIKDEKARIKAFYDRKDARLAKRKGAQPVSSKTTIIYDEGDMDEGYDDEESPPKPKRKKKHPSDKRPDNTDPIFDLTPPFIPTLDYVKCDNDFFYKIQGSTALENRCIDMTGKIRECFFSSIYATLLLVHYPLNKWDYRKVDIVIEEGRRMFKRNKTFQNCSQRTVNRVFVDNYLYNLVIKEFIINHKPRAKPLKAAINSFFESNKFLLLQYPNTTFAIYKDECYHLFDPYPSLNQCDKHKEKVKMQNLHNEPVVPDRNTASWILFPTTDFLLQYLSSRVTPDGLNSNYKLYTIYIPSFRKAPKRQQFAHYMISYPLKAISLPEEDYTEPPPEEVKWLETKPKIVPWSRLECVNMAKERRHTPDTMWKEFDIEIPNQLYSLWGNIHPFAPIFKNRGKQHLAITVMACLMSNLYRLDEWNQYVMDSIVIQGDQYFEESIADIDDDDYEFSLEDLNTEYQLGYIHFQIHLELKLFGTLYNLKLQEMNLARALTCFFETKRCGIILTMGKILAFGRGNNGFFMYDCQSYGYPLFGDDQGTSYVLKCFSLKRLLHCIIMTLRIPYYNIEFAMYSVECGIEYRKNLDNEDEEENFNDNIVGESVEY